MKYILLVFYFINTLGYVFSTLLPNLKILQLEEYKMIGVIKYNFKYRKIFFVSYVLSLLSILLLLCNGILLNILSCIVLAVDLLIYIFIYFKFKSIIPIYTNRIKRILITFSILSLCTIMLSSIYRIMLYICLFLSITCYLLTISSNYIIKIFEVFLAKFYIVSASKKLNKNKLIKVAITGSYGKTSVKNILNTILKEKYSVLMTPESYNTPSGLSLTINNNNLQNYEVLIMEMGAKKKGDIKYLCKYFKPDYGILTSIGCQHLLTFKNIDNIVQTKSEILDFVDSAVFNCDNEYVRELFKKYNKDKIDVGINNGSINAVIKELTNEKSCFDIYSYENFYCSAETQLVGGHNIINILLAVAIAIKLGLNENQIKTGISKLKPVKSRMEKTVLNSGAIVINNGYNSNPDSARSSLSLLNLYKGKRKIIITPGFVEMGESQYSFNYELGKLISESVDECIIVNKVNREALTHGLDDGNFKNYKVVSRFKDVDFSIFTANDVILVENDLPDNYV